VSFAFVTNFVDRRSMQGAGWLFAAWVSWGVSVTVALFSHLSSQWALRRAIKDLDAGTSFECSRAGCRSVI
jgi:hypothetical protein